MGSCLTKGKRKENVLITGYKGSGRKSFLCECVYGIGKEFNMSNKYDFYITTSEDDYRHYYYEHASVIVFMIDLSSDDKIEDSIVEIVRYLPSKNIIVLLTHTSYSLISTEAIRRQIKAKSHHDQVVKVLYYDPTDCPELCRQAVETVYQSIDSNRLNHLRMKRGLYHRRHHW